MRSPCPVSTARRRSEGPTMSFRFLEPPISGRPQKSKRTISAHGSSLKNTIAGCWITKDEKPAQQGARANDHGCHDPCSEQHGSRQPRSWLILNVGQKLRLADTPTQDTVVSMSTVQEIESAIEKLSDEEVAEIRAWLWDRDIERDARDGKFDTLAEEALREHRDGKTRKL